MFSGRDCSERFPGGAERGRHVGERAREQEVPLQHGLHEHLAVPQAVAPRQRADPPQHAEETVHVHGRDAVGRGPLVSLPQVRKTQLSRVEWVGRSSDAFTFL